MKPMIYLAGQMSGLSLKEMSEWRKEATTLLEENFKVISPINFYNFEIDPSNYTDKEVKEFDLLAVKKSDIVLINFDYPKSIGSAIEIHMAHDVWGIPVIAFGGKNVYIHPWMKVSVTKWCDTLEDAVNHILSFYLPLFR